MLSLKVCNWLLEQSSLLSQRGGERHPIRTRVNDATADYVCDHGDKKNASSTFCFVENQSYFSVLT